MCDYSGSDGSRPGSGGCGTALGCGDDARGLVVVRNDAGDCGSEYSDVGVESTALVAAGPGGLATPPETPGAGVAPAVGQGTGGVMGVDGVSVGQPLIDALVCGYNAESCREVYSSSYDVSNGFVSYKSVGMLDFRVKDLVGSGYEKITMADYFKLTHVGGHSCFHNVVAAVYGKSVPHRVTTFDGAKKFVGESRVKAVAAKPVGRVITLELHRKGEDPVVHVGLVPTTVAVDYGAILGAKWRIEWKVWSEAVLGMKDSGPLDVKMSNLGCSTAVSGCFHCGRVPAGKRYCSLCGFVVVDQDHETRCEPRRITEDVSLRAAQIGDVLHRLDVVLISMQLDLRDAERGPFIADQVSAARQSAWLCKWKPSQATQSERRNSVLFEASYIQFRERYVQTAFAGVSYSLLPEYSPTTLGFTIRAEMGLAMYEDAMRQYSYDGFPPGPASEQSTLGDECLDCDSDIEDLAKAVFSYRMPWVCCKTREEVESKRRVQRGMLAICELVSLEHRHMRRVAKKKIDSCKKALGLLGDQYRALKE